MKKMRLLYLYHAGANCQYFETMLRYLEGRNDFSSKIIRPVEIENTNFDDYDILEYLRCKT